MINSATLNSKDDYFISIIIPTRNRLEYLKITLKSLEQQSYKYFEIIVVDDDSNDKTWDYLLTCQSKTFKAIKFEKNLGESAAINAGYELAMGDYISVISDDDPQESTWISNMFSFISENPGYIFYYPNIRVVDECGVVVEDIDVQNWSKPLQLTRMRCLSSAGTVLNFREFAKPMSLRDNSVAYPSDLLMYNNLIKLGDGKKVPTTFGIWRSHSNNLTNSNNQEGRAIDFIKNCDNWIDANTDEYNLFTVKLAKLFVRLQAIEMVRHSYSNSKYLFKFLGNAKLSYWFVPSRIMLVFVYFIKKNKAKFNLRDRCISRLKRSKGFLQR
jgi:glycosyltransferase involved in cell wall biosynthesis